MRHGVPGNGPGAACCAGPGALRRLRCQLRRVALFDRRHRTRDQRRLGVPHCGGTGRHAAVARATAGAAPAAALTVTAAATAAPDTAATIAVAAPTAAP